MLLRTHIQLTEKEIEYGAEALIEILYIDECINWRRFRIFHFEEMFVCNERRGNVGVFVWFVLKIVII